MDELIPVSAPPKQKIKTFANIKKVFMFGLAIGIGLCLSVSAIVNLTIKGKARDFALQWFNIPWQFWIVVLSLFCILYLYVNYRIEKDCPNKEGKLEDLD